ncbi:MAG: O-antigen ligase family protein [Arthrospira platensis]
MGARLRAEALPLIPATLTVAVVVAWTATGGGYEALPTIAGEYDPYPWYLGALALVGLLLATVIGLGRVRLSLWAKVGCASLAGYVAWSFFSVLWAHDQGAAFLGSDRALVYLAAFATFAILPWRSWSLTAALAMLVAGIGALALIVAIKLAALSNPAGLFLNGRLSYPLGYYNADAAMFMLTALTSIALCSRRNAQPVLRVLAVTLAAVCLQLAVLGQSRGWLFTAPIVLVLALLLVPGRLRLLVFALGPALATAVTAPSLLRVYSRATVDGAPLAEPRLGRVLHEQGNHALRAMLVADVVLAVLTAIAVIADRRIELSRDTRRRLNVAGAAVATAALLGGLAVGLLAVHGHPVNRIEHAWSSFANASNTAAGPSRFTTLGSERVDFWRAGLHEFAGHPLLGIGQDNFAAGYLRLRHTSQEPRWVHSIELRLLVHTGLVGALLFALFLLATLLAMLRPARGRAVERSRRVAGGIALLPMTVWLAHGSIDWFWEIPALSVTALAFAGAATAMGTEPRDEPASEAPANPKRKRPGLTLARRLCAALLGAAALLAIAVPFLAAQETKRATLVWPTHPSLAYRELESASRLMPFNAHTDLVGGAIALNLEEYGEARAWFAKAARSDDRGWVAPFALGLVESERGRFAQARNELRLASSLNPREPILIEASKLLARNRRMTLAQVQALLGARARTRFGG